MTKHDLPTSRPSTRGAVLTCCDVGMAVAAAVAVSALALEYGFYDPPVSPAALHVVQLGVLIAFVLDRMVRLLVSPNRVGFLRENWIDFVLMAGAAGVALAASHLQVRVLSAAAVYVVITQVYILAVLGVRVVGFQVRVAGSGIHPIWVLMGSFAVVILFGTGLLMLPRAVPEATTAPLGLTDAVFTATSATCVTGLIVRDTGSEFSPFGQAVILALIQLGGLGIMVFGTVFAMLAGRALTVRESLLAGQVLSEATLGRIGRMVKFVILATFLVEAIGALVMFPMWRRYDPDAAGAEVAFRSAFHAVSAFCNAGFSLQRRSLIELADRWQVIALMAPMIVLGGLGFPVLYDLARGCWQGARLALRRRQPVTATLTLHSKLVLTTSAILLLGGAAGLLLIEHASDPGQTYGARITHEDNPPPAGETRVALIRLPPAKRVREAVFQSVTARTAGFNTVDVSRLSAGGKFWMCLLMIVGGSPASTAGGMKTATFAVLVLSIWCMLRRREQIESFRRTIAEGFVRKATVVAGLYLALVVVVTLLLSVSLSGRQLADGRPPSFLETFFEACSACGTVGLTCGVTGCLTTFGKYVIIAAMFIGRLGPLTVLLALTLRFRAVRYTYPNEEVVLG